MASILEIKAKKTTGTGDGTYGLDAEAAIDAGGGKVLYAHANWNADGTQYSVSETSIYDFMTGATSVDPGAEFIEVYDGLDDATGSDYHDVFAALEKVFDVIDV